MKRRSKIGLCPNCNDEIYIWRSNRGNRWAQCENSICDLRYGLPRRGHIESSGLTCPESKISILMITPSNNNTHFKRYFWTNKGCFSCAKSTNCKMINELSLEYNLHDSNLNMNNEESEDENKELDPRLIARYKRLGLEY